MKLCLKRVQLFCRKALIFDDRKKSLYERGVLSEMVHLKTTASNRKSLTAHEVIQGVFVDRDSDDAASLSGSEIETSSSEEVHSDDLDNEVQPKFNKITIVEEVQESKEVFQEHLLLRKDQKNRRRKKNFRRKVEKGKFPTNYSRIYS